MLTAIVLFTDSATESYRELWTANTNLLCSLSQLGHFDKCTCMHVLPCSHMVLECSDVCKLVIIFDWRLSLEWLQLVASLSYICWSLSQIQIFHSIVRQQAATQQLTNVTTTFIINQTKKSTAGLRSKIRISRAILGVYFCTQEGNQVWVV